MKKCNKCNSVFEDDRVSCPFCAADSSYFEDAGEDAVPTLTHERDDSEHDALTPLFKKFKKKVFLSGLVHIIPVVLQTLLLVFIEASYIIEYKVGTIEVESIGDLYTLTGILLLMTMIVIHVVYVIKDINLGTSAEHGHQLLNKYDSTPKFFILLGLDVVAFLLVMFRAVPVAEYNPWAWLPFGLVRVFMLVCGIVACAGSVNDILVRNYAAKIKDQLAHY